MATDYKAAFEAAVELIPTRYRKDLIGDNHYENTMKDPDISQGYKDKIILIRQALKSIEEKP